MEEPVAMAERLVGWYRTALLAGNEEFASARYTSAQMHFRTAIILARRMTILAGAGLLPPAMAVECSLDASENDAECGLRRRDFAAALNRHIETCHWLCGWCAYGEAAPELREVCLAALPDCAEKAGALQRRMASPEEEIAGLNARIAALCGVA